MAAAIFRSFTIVIFISVARAAGNATLRISLHATLQVLPRWSAGWPQNAMPAMWLFRQGITLSLAIAFIFTLPTSLRFH
jgi:hypothetical protein